MPSSMSASTESGSERRFSGGRYDRLRQGAEILAADPAVADAPFPFNGDGLRAFVAAVIENRIFDPLSERDSDLATMLLLLDFNSGPAQLAWNIRDWLSVRRNSRNADDTWAIVSALAVALKIVIDQVSSVHRQNS